MLDWMAWTPITAWFFAAIATLLMVMTLLQVVYPTVARAGWLERFGVARNRRG